MIGTEDEEEHKLGALAGAFFKHDPVKEVLERKLQ